jgi:hypothetical protein
MSGLEPPNADQVEVTLLGPGYGECCLIHIGDNRWVVIDSCKGNTERPACLDYFSAIGVDPRLAVEWVIVTHWHDDHVYKMSELVKTCESANICMSAAASRSEFSARAAPYYDSVTLAGGSGVYELFELAKEINRAERIVTNAIENRRLQIVSALELSHNCECEIWTLSPSDYQFDLFFRNIATLIPGFTGLQRRVPSTGPNHLAVVVFIKIGTQGIPLGADLEEIGKNSTGWSSIVASPARPQIKSSIFKVPHHGSITGHLDSIWEQLLSPQPISITTPYNRGRSPLPTTRDVARIRSRSKEFYVTSRHSKSVRKRDPAVKKTIKEMDLKVEPIDPPFGIVQLRNKGILNMEAWSASLMGPAYRA